MNIDQGVHVGKFPFHDDGDFLSWGTPQQRGFVLVRLKLGPQRLWKSVSYHSSSLVQIWHNCQQGFLKSWPVHLHAHGMAAIFIFTLASHKVLETFNYNPIQGLARPVKVNTNLLGWIFPKTRNDKFSLLINKLTRSIKQRGFFCCCDLIDVVQVCKWLHCVCCRRLCFVFFQIVEVRHHSAAHDSSASLYTWILGFDNALLPRTFPSVPQKRNVCLFFWHAQ